MHGDAVKARPGREKTKNIDAAQGSLWLVRFDPEDSIPRIGCFLSAFVHLLQTLPKEVSQSTATKVESGISGANRRVLVCESLETGKEGQNACQKIQIEFVSKGSWTPDAVGEERKNRALAQASFREKIIVIQSQRKAISKYGIWAGFWFGSSWARSQAVGRSIYIYIIGSAEALPILCVRYFRWERERDTERERDRDGSDVTIFALKLAMNLHSPSPKIRTIGNELTLSLAKNSHFSFLPSHLPSLPSRRGHHCGAEIRNEFTLSIAKSVFALFVPPLSNGTSRDEWSKTQDNWSNPAQPYFVLPIEKMNQINTKNYWK